MDFVHDLAWLLLGLIVVSVVSAVVTWNMRVGVYMFTLLYVLLMGSFLATVPPCDHHPRELQCLADLEMQMRDGLWNEQE